ncbi:sugar kinase [Breznakiella homolactica]|uniref:Sugar kinase n=1 Tax=Breznakiella homolactica TaxID=2798577 RepID=A0A7T7XL74_9SPIR|nr:sugar kinase [Breznakiella homolactica]QQO08439.1 sugar kinase [Breznakiella homolactica]
MDTGQKNIVLFGELLLHLGTKGVERILQANEFEIRFTGAEANVGVSCANYGMGAYAVSKVPEGDIGQACLSYLNRFGLDTSLVARGGERLGLFYSETGHSQRASKVIYDRAHSSFSEIHRGEFDWEKVLAGKHWLHFCGTAPAQGEEVVSVLIEGLKAAQSKGITVSVDYNYRSKLWDRDTARAVMERLMPYVNIGIGNEEDCEAMFGISAEGSDYGTGTINTDSYEIVAKKMVEKFGLTCQAITLRESISANRNGWSAIVHDGNDCYRSRKYTIDIIDRIGAGDSFSGGFIYSVASGSGFQDALEFAAAASCLKHTIPGDFNLVSKKDVEALIGGNATGRVQR